MMRRQSRKAPATIREDEPLLDTKDEDEAEPDTSFMRLTNGRADESGQVIIRSRRAWIVKLGPVKKHMFKGHLIRTVRGLGFGSKRRKLSIQVEAPLPPHKSKEGGLHLGQLFGHKEEDLTDDSSRHTDTGTLEKLGEHDVVWIKIFKRPKTATDDDTSVLTDGETGSCRSSSSFICHTLDPGFADTFSPLRCIESSVDEQNQVSSADQDEYRIETDVYEMSDIEILHKKGTTLECKLGTGNETTVRDLKFLSSKEADAFMRVIASMGELTIARTQQQLRKFRESNAPTKAVVQQLEQELTAPGEPSTDKEIAVLCEIVSAQSLPVADLFSTDPYIIVRMGKTEIHRTSVISKDRDPIFTIQTGSLFLLEMSPEEFFAFPSLNFVVKDFDGIGTNEILGAVHVPLQDVLTGTGVRQEYQITPRKGFLHGHNEEFKPRLYLRFRPATKDDISVSSILG
jgi:hypothetical protein